MAEESFGRRLRDERERRRITLESIAANTKISIGLLRDLERDELIRWPSGIFRRSFLRGYAEAIGLNPDDTLQEFLERFPEPRTSGGNAAAPRLGMDRQVPIGGRVHLRLTLADAPHPFSGGAILTQIRVRLAAAAWDAGVMLALATTAYVVLGRFWAPLGVTMLCYYVGGILLLGNTPGVCLFAPASHPDDPGPTPPQGEDEGELHGLDHAFGRS